MHLAQRIACAKALRQGDRRVGGTGIKLGRLECREQWNEAGEEHKGQSAGWASGYVEELGLDIIILTALVLTVIITGFQMNKIRLREVHLSL